jgi:CDP-diacylglycerol--serine O-phosphatidyltransferase
MIGVYDYTVILTYMSLISAGTAIAVSLSGAGHPYLGMLFFLICGICDLFDGKVARSKKNRTDIEKRFGIQIDSLSDLVAFGILPSCIGIALIRRSTFLNETVHITDGSWPHRILYAALIGVMLLYALAALIRLGWYNVTEEERQKTEEGNRKYFVGIPVTMSTFFFSIVFLLEYMIPADLSLMFFGMAILLTFGFIAKIQIPKPGLKGVGLMIGVVGVVFAILLVLKLIFKW